MENVEQRYDTAVETAREAIEELRLAAYAKGYEDARRELMEQEPKAEEFPLKISDEDIESAIKEARRYLAQERRDEIVEQAKADVLDLKNRDIGHDHEFIVNAKKRTVVVLRKLRGCTNIVGRGIAKATPDDCFNVHIGKAIALHRALGLEVPDEYLNAPQPTEVRVGDVVRYVPTTGHVKEFTVGKIADGKAYDSDHPGLFAYLDAQNRYSLPCINPKTIDDSRTEVGE